MSLEFKKVKTLFEAKQWVLDGWHMFKKKPLTWMIMLLIFNIIMIIGSTHFISRYILALLLPVLTGGIFLAAHNSAQGKAVSIENLFSMFKHREKLKQLLIIGGIGAVVLFLSGVLGLLVTLPWSFVLLFGVPLVVIKDEQALSALQNSLFAAVFNLLPLILFYFITIILVIVSAIPFGLGLLILIPVLFGASYSAFKTVFLESDPVKQDAAESVDNKTIEAVTILPNDSDDDNAPELNWGEKLANNMRAYMIGETDSDGETTLPRGFNIDYHDEYMHIVRRWHGFETFGLIIGMLLFNGVWIANDFWAVLMSDRGLFLKAFALTFIIIGAVMLYLVIANWLNKSHIYVSKEAIEIKHEPIPWLGNKRVETNNIKQLFVKEIGGNSQSMTSNRSPSYSVIGVTHEEEQFNLIKGLSRSNQAFYIEQRIEKYLGIKDEANPDEFGYGFLKRDN